MIPDLPPEYRKVLYIVGYVLGVVSALITTVWATIAASSPDVTMPLPLVITQAVLGLVLTQLNLLAGANVPSVKDVENGEVLDPQLGRHRAV